jgi:hypothetical protein
MVLGTVTEWLRWQIRNLLSSGRMGSNPIGVGSFLSCLNLFFSFKLSKRMEFNG